MTIVEKARLLRPLIEKASAFLSDADAFGAPELFPKWEVGIEYKTGDRIRYGKDLYKVLQNHTSQADWTPDTAVSLYVKVSDPAIEWPDWVQPTGSHDAYMTGDKVSHNEKHWVSQIDNNVWEPGIYGWSER